MPERNDDAARAATLILDGFLDYHERFADHAVSVAKKVVYLATGDWAADTDAIVTQP